MVLSLDVNSRLAISLLIFTTYRLVVEVDGPIHDHQKEADAARQQILEMLGLIVLRIQTEIVEKNLPMALEVIRNSIRMIKENHASPSPDLGESQGGGC